MAKQTTRGLEHFAAHDSVVESLGADVGESIVFPFAKALVGSPLRVGQISPSPTFLAGLNLAPRYPVPLPLSSQRSALADCLCMTRFSPSQRYQLSVCRFYF